MEQIVDYVSTFPLFFITPPTVPYPVYNLSELLWNKSLYWVRPYSFIGKNALRQTGSVTLEVYILVPWANFPKKFPTVTNISPEEQLKTKSEWTQLSY